MSQTVDNIRFRWRKKLENLKIDQKKNYSRYSEERQKDKIMDKSIKI